MLLAAVQPRRLASDETVLEAAPMMGPDQRPSPRRRRWPGARARPSARRWCAVGFRRARRTAAFRRGARWSPAHDVDARDDGAEVIGSPMHEGEDAVRCKSQDATEAIERQCDCFRGRSGSNVRCDLRARSVSTYVSMVPASCSGARPAFGSALISHKGASSVREFVRGPLTRAAPARIWPP